MGNIMDMFKSAEVSSGYENLARCIERYSLNDKTFYCDTRLGVKIDDRILHPAYEKQAIIKVKPVDLVTRIQRTSNVFQIWLVSDGFPEKDMVIYYSADNTFSCNRYDPTILIPHILQMSDSSDYLRPNNHPFYKFGYIADYSWYPDETYINAELGVEAKYVNAADEIYKTSNNFQGSEYCGGQRAFQIKYEDDEDWNYSSDSSDDEANYSDPNYFYKNREIDEPVESSPISDCSSCGIPEFEGDFMDQVDDLPTITQADIDELENLFGNKSNITSEEDLELPKKPLRKITTVNTEEMTKLIQEYNQKRNEELKNMRELYKILNDVSDYVPPPKDIIPVLAPREDNL